MSLSHLRTLALPLLVDHTHSAEQQLEDRPHVLVWLVIPAALLTVVLSVLLILIVVCNKLVSLKNVEIPVQVLVVLIQIAEYKTMFQLAAASLDSQEIHLHIAIKSSVGSFVLNFILNYIKIIYYYMLININILLK